MITYCGECQAPLHVTKSEIGPTYIIAHGGQVADVDALDFAEATRGGGLNALLGTVMGQFHREERR